MGTVFVTPPATRRRVTKPLELEKTYTPSAALKHSDGAAYWLMCCMHMPRLINQKAAGSPRWNKERGDMIRRFEELHSISLGALEVNDGPEIQTAVADTFKVLFEDMSKLFKRRGMRI